MRTTRNAIYAAGIVVLACMVIAPEVCAAAITPSFDCAVAKSAVDKLICSDESLAARDRELAARYSKLQHTLPAEGFETIRHRQREWLKSVHDCERDLSGNEPPRDLLLLCVESKYQEQLDSLANDMPQTVGGLTLEHRFRSYSARKPDVEENDDYPWLVGAPEGKATVFNRYITEQFKLGKGMFAAAGIKLERNVKGTNSYDRSFTIGLFNERLISLEVFEHHEATFGHGWISEYTLNWDLSRNRPFDEADLFRADVDWEQSVKQYAIESMDDDKQNPEEIADGASAWLFKKDGAVLLLGIGEVAAVNLPVEIPIPYSFLAPLLRPDAPLPVPVK